MILKSFVVFGVRFEIVGIRQSWQCSFSEFLLALKLLSSFTLNLRLEELAFPTKVKLKLEFIQNGFPSRFRIEI